MSGQDGGALDCAGNWRWMGDLGVTKNPLLTCKGIRYGEAVWLFAGSVACKYVAHIPRATGVRYGNKTE